MGARTQGLTAEHTQTQSDEPIKKLTLYSTPNPSGETMLGELTIRASRREARRQSDGFQGRGEIRKENSINGIYTRLTSKLDCYTITHAGKIVGYAIMVGTPKGCDRNEIGDRDERTYIQSLALRMSRLPS